MKDEKIVSSSSTSVIIQHHSLNLNDVVTGCPHPDWPGGHTEAQKPVPISVRPRRIHFLACNPKYSTHCLGV